MRPHRPLNSNPKVSERNEGSAQIFESEEGAPEAARGSQEGSELVDLVDISDSEPAPTPSNVTATRLELLKKELEQLQTLANNYQADPQVRSLHKPWLLLSTAHVSPKLRKRQRAAVDGQAPSRCLAPALVDPSSWSQAEIIRSLHV